MYVLQDKHGRMLAVDCLLTRDMKRTMRFATLKSARDYKKLHKDDSLLLMLKPVKFVEN